MPALVGGLLIFLARLIYVSLAMVRTLLGVRHQKYLATTIGFFQSLVFTLAISQVSQDVGNVWNVLGYCGGFAAGTSAGLVIEGKMAGDEIALTLRQEGYGVMEVVGDGLDGRFRL